MFYVLISTRMIKKKLVIKSENPNFNIQQHRTPLLNPLCINILVALDSFETPIFYSLMQVSGVSLIRDDNLKINAYKCLLDVSVIDKIRNPA